jgi:hypothetical protein
LEGITTKYLIARNILALLIWGKYTTVTNSDIHLGCVSRWDSLGKRAGRTTDHPFSNVRSGSRRCEINKMPATIIWCTRFIALCWAILSLSDLKRTKRALSLSSSSAATH